MRRGGFVLVAVIVVIAAAILVATGAIFAARAAVVVSRSSDFEERLRAAALDGVTVVSDLLARDRVRLLGGGTPASEPLLLEIEDGPRRIEVRLVPQPGGEYFASEAGKLDANQSAPEVMGRVVESAGESAREVVAAMVSARPLTSVDASAALVPIALSASALRDVMGPLVAIGEEHDELEDGAERSGLPPPLISLFTVHGAEPLVSADGRPRLDLAAAFGTDGVGARASASLGQFTDAEREALEAVAKKPGDSPDDGLLVRALVARGIELVRIDEILDVCTIEEGSHGAPRLDIVRADVRTLAALDGIGPDAAARIVDLRESLDDTERRGTSWLVSRRILTADQWIAVAGRITGRSALWRFRVEAKFVAPDDAPAEPKGTVDLDCVIDVSPERNRIAFLRDVSLLPTARALPGASRSASRPAPDDGPSDQSASVAPSASSSEPRFDAPPPSATIEAVAEPITPRRGRARPIGRDIGGSGELRPSRIP